MTWGKMDDKFHRNPKVRALRQTRGGRAALGTWVYWWSWCLDDPEFAGVVPANELSNAEEKCAELLVQVGLWDRIDVGYRFHDFHNYNPTKSQIEAKRAADRERVSAKRHGKRADVARDSCASRERIESDSAASRTRVAPRARLPSRPDPNSPLPPEGAGATRCADQSPEPATTVDLVAAAIRSEASARHMAPAPLVPRRDLQRAAERADALVLGGVAPDATAAATALVHAAFALGEGPQQRPLRFALLEATVAGPNGQSRHVPPEDPWV